VLMLGEREADLGARLGQLDEHLAVL